MRSPAPHTILAAVLAVAATCVAVPRALAAQYGDAVVAVVEDEVITVYDLQQVASRREAELRRQYSGEELRQKIIEVRKLVARDLVERALIHAEFQSLEATIPEDALQERVNTVIVQRTGGDRRRFEEMLADEGMTFAEFEEQMGKQLAVDLLLNEKVNRRLRVSPSDVDRYYREHRDDLAQEAGVRLQAIVLKKDGDYRDKLNETVKEIQQQLRSGTSFGELAKTYSEGPHADKGGDQGWIVRPSAKLQAAVDDMKVSDVTQEPLDMGSGLYLIKLTDRRGAGIPALDDQLRRQIEDTLKQQERQRRYAEFIETLKQKYFVKMPDDFGNGKPPAAED